MSDRGRTIGRKVVFVDRDGVLIENCPQYVRKWEDVEFLPRALEAGKLLADRDHAIVVVTNQACVGREILDLDEALSINERILAEFRRNGTHILASYLCPHHPDDDCDCRKPKPGMLVRGLKEFGVAPDDCWMVGDALTDMQAAEAANVQGVLVRTGRGQQQEASVSREGNGKWPVFDDLWAAANWILGS